MSLVDNHNSVNTQKWRALYLSLQTFADEKYLNDHSQWVAECNKAGFRDNLSTKVYGEMPAPDTTEFPFENQIMRWMACHVFVSAKG